MGLLRAACAVFIESEVEMADIEKGFSLLTPELEALADAEEKADALAKEKIDNMQVGDVIGEVTSVNIAAKKGARKKPIESGVMGVREDFGCVDDAHASGEWHRQISFLAEESIKKAQNRGLSVKEGDFAENVTTRGFMPFFIPIGTVLQVGDVRVEISQIGKVCHTRCAIYYLAGDCIFPREGIFGVVLDTGDIKVGDKISVVKIGDGTCSKTPQEAIDEVEAARAAGTL